jgi:hypothetical protein
MCVMGLMKNNNPFLILFITSQHDKLYVFLNVEAVTLKSGEDNFISD